MAKRCILYSFSVPDSPNPIQVARIFEQDLGTDDLAGWPSRYLAAHPECNDIIGMALVRLVDETKVDNG